MKKFHLFFLMALLVISCTEKDHSFKVERLVLFENFEFETDTLELEMDLSGGPFEPIFLPSQNNSAIQQAFDFSFTIKNFSDKAETYSYKIYYQNVSYAHSLLTRNGEYNIKSENNFYGSWIADSLISFKEVTLDSSEKLMINDRIQIAGNPLNDSTFYYPDPMEKVVSKDHLEELISFIRSDEKWFENIKQKAASNNQSVEDQLYGDALWTIQNDGKGKIENRRWQNNPRVGLYKFMLVVGTKKEIEKLPHYILDPKLRSENHNARVNPFYFFQNAQLAKGLHVSVAKEYLRTFAVLRPQYGLYFNPQNFKQDSSSQVYCSSSGTSHRKAHFAQYLNTEVRDSSLNNINFKYDVVGDNMTREQFSSHRSSNARDPNSYTVNGMEPCINARYDENENAIIVENPGNSERPYRKENAGVEGRIGFTYGKFIGKIRFPEILSEDHVWNGVTCAFWLKFQSLSEWNMRDTCFGSGYLKSGYNAEQAVYSPTNSYSEIDIEIVKTSRFWPETSEQSRDIDETYDPALDRNLIVTCTNWDLACQEPSASHVGSVRTPDGRYYSHRWTEWYKALTIKTERPSSQTVGSVIKYEIEWKPTDITWRIGPDLELMTEVGYMDSSITKIPNNQMVPVMSQEFHYGHWWPTTPFPQGDIPYPAAPVTGYLYEVEIR